MAFVKYNEDGVQKRKPVLVDCSGDEVRTEQNHKGSVDINDIVAKQGV
jgi:hypothetical protein